MPEIGNTAVFSQTDANNNTGTMPSWLGSAAPSTIDDAGRAFQGAVTREWNWRNFTLTAGGTADAKTLTYSVAPAAYYTGQIFCFIANTTNTGTATLNVNSLGAKTIKKDVSGTMTALAADDMVSGMRVMLAYDGTDLIWVNRGNAPSASTTVSGIIEIATTTEQLTGTDATRAASPDSVAALWEKGADVASAGTISLGEGGYFHVTGTTTITDIDFATATNGRGAWVIFDGALTLTHNATTLLLPGGANITTAANDRAHFVQDAADNVICTAYVKADGTAVVASSGTAASQAEQETASDTTKFVSPGRQHFHPGHPKVWARAAGAGTLTESYNMTSVTDTGTGDLDGTIATDFSTATWGLIASVVVPTLDTTHDYKNNIININAQGAGTFGLENGEWSIDDDTISEQNIVAADPTSYSMLGLGDHA